MKWDTEVFGLKELCLIFIVVIFIISWFRSKNIDLDDDVYKNYSNDKDNDKNNNEDNQADNTKKGE